MLGRGLSCALAAGVIAALTPRLATKIAIFVSRFASFNMFIDCFVQAIHRPMKITSFSCAKNVPKFFHTDDKLRS